MQSTFLASRAARSDWALMSLALLARKASVNAILNDKEDDKGQGYNIMGIRKTLSVHSLKLDSNQSSFQMLRRSLRFQIQNILAQSCFSKQLKIKNIYSITTLN